MPKLTYFTSKVHRAQATAVCGQEPMVRKSEDPTLRQMKVPIALIIDGDEKLIRELSKAALVAQVLVAECTARDAPTIAAEMRPLILAMSQRIFGKNREGFEALARDIRASMLVLPESGSSANELQALLESKMSEAEAQRSSWPG